MLTPLRSLLAACLLLLLPGSQAWSPRYNNGFHYQDISHGNGKERVRVGSSVTLPCHFHYEPEPSAPRRTRVKWSWLPANTVSAPVSLQALAMETEVMVAMGNRHRSYGNFKGRVRLRRSAPGDMSLVINGLQLNDTGRYRCEVIDGLEDESVTVDLEMRGVVFPYFSQKGRYLFNFFEAKQACKDQEATLATFEQLFTAWDEGLDWCNAGWLADGTVQYPITAPRDGCGGDDLAPGTVYFLKHHTSSTSQKRSRLVPVMEVK
ncbi:hypothetical protein F7725_023228 [Dissostichus mawsoni]|uniref:Hyaluronan and proteoglycan link protein 3 n=1 Tax=Dissostichus mawsoni TaxID=36200 RepID=A0A7J5Z128_DISMA|nr:hypothetical protein F7725_023228 [Dissostichus mawsoni]